jgi:signal transduction histidine kinase
LARFDEHWLEQVQWLSLDRCAELSRWQVRDRQARRRWLVVRAGQQASLWTLARLDREYALGPMLDAAWAAMPLARLSSAKGSLLVFDDDGGRPLSASTTTPLSIERFLNLAIAATKALGAAHRHGIIHCDICPGNLMVGDTDDVRLTGFAFAQVLHDLGDSTLALATDSLAYLAPELHGRHKPVFTPQSDLYALGVTLFEVLTGHLPFSASDPVQWLHQHLAVAPPLASHWRDDLPPAVTDLLAGLLAKAAQSRPASAEQVEIQLRSCLNAWHDVGKAPNPCPLSPIPNRPADPQAALRIAYAEARLSIKARILDADYATADAQIERVLSSAEQPLHRAELYRLRCEIFSLRGDYPTAVCTAIDGLAALGVIFSPTPSNGQMQQGLQSLQQALDGRGPKVFLDLPQIQDARCQSILELLAAMVIPGSFIHPHLMLVTTCKMAVLTLQHGMSAAAVHGIAWLGVASGHQFHAYEQGYEYAGIAHKLLEQPGYASSKVSVLLALDQISVWTRPLPFALECAESAYRESILQGLSSFACYANNHIVSNLLVLGAPIERMLRQIDSGLALARNLAFVDAQMILYAQARYIRRLAGNVAGSVAIPDSAVVAERVSRSRMGPLRFWWALYEGLLCFLDEDHPQAGDHFDAAWALSWSAPAHIHLVDLAMFSVLNLAALQRLTGKPQDVENPMYHLRLWAQLNPRYFSDRLALAEAELLHLDGRSLQALQRYEAAIEHAQHCGAVHLLGLSHTLASRCHQQLGLQSSQHVHLRKAHEAWCRWGAMALAQRLEAEHPFLREGSPAHARDDFSSTSEKLDLLSITRACQALSREIEPDALIRTLLTNAMTHAGATYAALMLEHAGSLCVEATGHSRSHGIDICLGITPATAQTVPLNLIQQVQREHESLLINVSDALRRGNVDPYLAHLESGSIMCLPLIQQNEVIGVLYLENALTPDAFESSRIGVLELLAAQAAISLSTARYHTDLHAARKALDRTSQATILGELAASIAHEINQPLASILSNAGASIRWLQRDQPQIGEAIEGIQDILTEGQRTADIIRAMRALAKQAPLERKPLAMDSVIRQVLAITQPDRNEKHVMTVEKLAIGALVFGDSIQLQQVMRNLIINAVEAMQALPPGARRLTLETRLVGQELLTLVEDSGPGVPTDKSAYIFETFYSTKPSGMGMGLAICATIVATHGGFLGYTEGRRGESLFFFTLPIQSLT